MNGTKTAYFFDVPQPSDSESLKMAKVVRNTGNLVFAQAIQDIFEIDLLDVRKLDPALESYDQFITTHLIWIREEFPSPPHVVKMLDAPGGKKVVPLSIGLQSTKQKSDFFMSPETIRLLKRLEERTKLAVRGNYTAEILSNYGIKNVQPIGCPSIYTYPVYQSEHMKLKGNVKKICSSFETFHGRMSEDKEEFLSYASRFSDLFVEQTPASFEAAAHTNSRSAKLDDWMSRSKAIFYDVAEWRQAMSEYDFCIGGRFHGSVVSMLAGVPSLLLVSDSRTMEMTELFGLPRISYQDFDATLPIKHYYEMTASADFHRRLPTLTMDLLKYAAETSLPIRADYRNALDAFKWIPRKSS